MKKNFLNTQVGLNNKNCRDEWLEETLNKIPKKSKILDAGAGELQYRKFCKHLDYVSQDFGEYDGEGNAEGLQTKSWDNSKLDIVSDIVDIPVITNSFDSVMCIEVLEHLSEPALAIKEFARILKSDGDLILTAPFCSLTHFAPYYFANGYSQYWYQGILNKYGFEIIQLKFNGNYFEYLAQELRRLKSIAKKYGRLRKVDHYILKIINFLALPLLQHFSKIDNGSNKLLCFGLHIHAKKK